MNPPLAFIGGIGTPELVFIAIIALLLFGGKNLPHAARSFGRALREFKKASADIERELKSAIEETPPPPAALPPPASDPVPTDEETYDYTKDYAEDDPYTAEEQAAFHPDETDTDTPDHPSAPDYTAADTADAPDTAPHAPEPSVPDAPDAAPEPPVTSPSPPPPAP
ncbi:MAG: twin-arginine translocase TatA/TatE family subunit [Opitutaceae bacterium]|jgi:sec-independent protein translocase protein TatA|nr:twin-arginine translocase TatA/TatE family subunit [Opitutaceae bacterium]